MLHWDEAQKEDLQTWRVDRNGCKPRWRHLGLDTQVIRVPGSAKTAQLAAEAVGCAVGAIMKSLVFVVDGVPVVVSARATGA